MTTAKTISELETLVVEEMRETCPECQQIAGAVIMPTDDPRREGAWSIADLVRGPTVATLICRRAQAAATLRLRQRYHLMPDVDSSEVGWS